MEKYIMRSSYWLGILSAVLALLARGLNLLGVQPLQSANSTTTTPLGYRTFLSGATLFFLITISTAVYAWFHSGKSPA